MDSLTVKPLDVLRTRFGHDAFRPGQEEVIEALVSGQSVAAVLPTGAGKSLLYQLPALIFEGLTLVVSPLLALMKDQVDALLEKGIAAARLDSSLSAAEYREVLSRGCSGELKLLYVSPERFNNERFRGVLGELPVSLMAIDEAHCVSEWGHNFRPDYLKLPAYAALCGAERILAITATATPKVLSDIQSSFSIETAVRSPFHRPNLHLRVALLEDPEAKLPELIASLKSREPGPSIIYVTLQKTAVEVAAALAGEGFDARPYHAGLADDVRVETQDWFLRSPDGLVVATIAFGMGIDKPDIRAVYHYDPPKSLENYSQEIGRAGRDGEVSLCQFFYHPADRVPLENFVYDDTPSRDSIHSLLRSLFSGERELLISLYRAGREHDLRPLVLRTLLTYLELDGYLVSLTPVYASYRFKPRVSSRELLSHYQGGEQRFLAEVLKCSSKKRVWFEIDIDATAAKLGCERSRVVAVLDGCGNDGWLELKASDLRHRYRLARQPESLEGLADELHHRALEREKQENGRLDQAVLLATHRGCLGRYLASHFGETLEHDCGTCSVCRQP